MNQTDVERLIRTLQKAFATKRRRPVKLKSRVAKKQHPEKNS